MSREKAKITGVDDPIYARTQTTANYSSLSDLARKATKQWDIQVCRAVGLYARHFTWEWQFIRPSLVHFWLQE